jgi:site-specific recombinase XerD
MRSTLLFTYVYGSTAMHKPTKPRSFKHSFATHLLESEYDLYIAQGLPEHSDISATETHPRDKSRRKRRFKSG